MATQAKLLLDNPAFLQALSSIKGGLLAAWQGTAINDTSAREEYHRRYIAVTTIEGILRDYLHTGIMANLRVEEERRQESRLDALRRFWRGPDKQPNVEGIV